MGEFLLGKKAGNRAPLWGGIIGTVPDLDVVTFWFFDVVTATRMHRGFTHSLLFCLLLPPVLAPYLYKGYRRKTDASPWGWANLLFWVLLTHILLDCMTTWGTKIFWPFGYKVAWQNIFVVDPLYTLPLLLFLILSLFKRPGRQVRRRLIKTGLIVSSAYLAITFFNKGYIGSVFQDSLDDQEREVIRWRLRPTPLNSVLWSAIVETPHGYMIGYRSLFDDPDRAIDYRFFPKRHTLLRSYHKSSDLLRLVDLTEGWFVVKPKDGGMELSDLRFGEFYDRKKEKGRFVFRYQIEEEDGRVTVRRKERKIGMTNKKLLAFFRRIIGAGHG